VLEGGEGRRCSTQTKLGARNKSKNAGIRKGKDLNSYGRRNKGKREQQRGRLTRGKGSFCRPDKKDVKQKKGGITESRKPSGKKTNRKKKEKEEQRSWSPRKLGSPGLKKKSVQRTRVVHRRRGVTGETNSTRQTGTRTEGDNLEGRDGMGPRGKSEKGEGKRGQRGFFRVAGKGKKNKGSDRGASSQAGKLNQRGFRNRKGDTRMEESGKACPRVLGDEVFVKRGGTSHGKLNRLFSWGREVTKMS